MPDKKKHLHLTRSASRRRLYVRVAERIPHWFVPTMIIVAVVGALAVALVVFESRRTRPPPSEPRHRSRDERVIMYRRAGELLGQYIADVREHDRVLVVLPPPARRSAEDAAALAGFRAVLHDEALLTFVTPADDEDAPPAFWLQPAAFDAVVAAHPASDVVVSLAGLPIGPGKMQFWHWPNKPDLVLFNASPVQLEKLITEGDIAAILIRRPGQAGEPPRRPPEDPQNWLLITTQNFQDVTAEYPKLFSY